MLFYHYNELQFDELKSLVAQGRKGNSSQVEREGFFSSTEQKIQKIFDMFTLKGEHTYDRHVSLFFEPIPLNIAALFEDKHEYWQSGKLLIEHVVHLDAIPNNISYSVEETPEKTKLLYETQDWSKVKEQPELIKVFKQEIRDVQLKNGYIGHGKNNMVRACKHLAKGIEKYYAQAGRYAKQFPEDGGYSKYAATVPHLMIYPGYKPIAVASTRTIVLQ